MTDVVSGNDDSERSLAEIFEGLDEDSRQAVRRKVDEYMAGFGAVRDGVAHMYFIELGDETGVSVKSSNVDEVEASVRGHYGEIFPDLLPDGQETATE